MTTTQKWTPEHWRSGCWVESYTRSNGVRVSRHWRSGGSVQSHYSLVNQLQNPTPRDPNPHPNIPRRRTTWPRARTSTQGSGKPGAPKVLTYIPLVLHPSANNAALALALDQMGPYRVWPKSPPDRTRPDAPGTYTIRAQTGFARLTSVTWENPNATTQHAGELTLAANALTLPRKVKQISMTATITHPDGRNRELTLETPIFFNADGTISTVPAASVDPEDAVRMIKALEQKNGDPLPKSPGTDQAQAARIHNQVREQLGNPNPERHVRQAMVDTVRLIPPPALNIEKSITIPCPNTSYVITISPAPPPGPEPTKLTTKPADKQSEKQRR